MTTQTSKWQCRISPTLGDGFAGTPNKVWGTKDYKDLETPTVFFGCYGLPDLMVVRQHKGRKAILWAGTDVTYLINGYWLDDKGEFRLDPFVTGRFLNKTCENWCENDLERHELLGVGIDAKVCPSYLGDVKKIKPCYKPGKKAYISVSGDDFKAYGWDKLEQIAKHNPDMELHLYGRKGAWYHAGPPDKFGIYPKLPKNIIDHGRVPQEQINEEIKDMQIGIRLNEHDGFSEIIAKAVLMEQYVLSAIDYPFLSLGRKKARQWLLKNVNKYPWNSNT